MAQLVMAIRQAKTTTACVSNYKKNGMRFRNNLSLHPLFDTASNFRYVLGIASDADEGMENAQLLLGARRLVPTTCPVPRAGVSRPLSHEQAMSRSQTVDISHLRYLMALFTSLLCIDNPRRWFSVVVHTPSVFQCYASAHKEDFTLSEMGPSSNLELVYLSSEMARLRGKPLKDCIERIWQGMHDIESATPPKLSLLANQTSDGAFSTLVGQLQGTAQDNDVTVATVQVKVTLATADGSSTASGDCRVGVSLHLSRLSKGTGGLNAVLTHGSFKRRLSADAQSKQVYDRLKQAERYVAERHWLEHVQSERKDLADVRRFTPKGKYAQPNL